MSNAPKPVVNGIEKPFWDAIDENQLIIQQCTDCDSHTYPPRVACPECFGSMEWEEASGFGEVYTYGVVHRPSNPEFFAKLTPYVVVVVELEEGPRLLSQMVNVSTDEVYIGQRVEVTYEELEEGHVLPMFEAVADQ